MNTDTSLQPGFVLHRHPYRDTSLLLEVFSAEHGRLGLVARGARTGRRGAGQSAVLQAFQPLLLSWQGRGELATLTGAEADGPALPLKGPALFSGFYVNELILRLLPRHDPHPELYVLYRSTLEDISVDQRPWRLRLFERDLLEALGYGLNLSVDTESQQMLSPDTLYSYHFEQGPRRARPGETTVMPIHGRTLLTLAGETGSTVGPDEQAERESKRLMRWVLRHYLGDKPLATRELFRQTYGRTDRNHHGDEQDRD